MAAACVPVVATVGVTTVGATTVVVLAAVSVTTVAAVTVAALAAVNVVVAAFPACPSRGALDDGLGLDDHLDIEPTRVRGFLAVRRPGQVFLGRVQQAVDVYEAAVYNDVWDLNEALPLGALVLLPGLLALRRCARARRRRRGERVGSPRSRATEGGFLSDVVVVKSE